MINIPVRRRWTLVILAALVLIFNTTKCFRMLSLALLAENDESYPALLILSVTASLITSCSKFAAFKWNNLTVCSIVLGSSVLWVLSDLILFVVLFSKRSSEGGIPFVLDLQLLSTILAVQDAAISGNYLQHRDDADELATKKQL